MSDGAKGSRRLRAWPAALVFFAAALPPAPAGPNEPVMGPAPTSSMPSTPAALSGRADALRALAQCTACHAPRDAALPPPLQLVTSGTRGEAWDPPVPVGDDTLLRAGGEVYTVV